MSVAYQIFQAPKHTQIDASVRVTPGAKAYFYASTTSTPQDTYTDADLTIPSTNPVVADANGVFAPIYLDPTKRYKLTLNTAADVLIYTVDPVNDQVLTALLIGQYLYPETLKETSVSAVPVAFNYPPGHAFRYMTTAQIADVLGYGYTLNVATAVQAAINTGNTFCPNGGYLHSGLTLNDQGHALRGESYYGTIFKYTGSGDGVTVASGSHHCEISEVTLNGNASQGSGNAVLKWTNAAWGKLDRVVVNAGGMTGAGRVVFIIQEASFDFVMNQCQIDGENTAELGMLMRDNGAASGPNTFSSCHSRIQQCTTGLDIEDGNNLNFFRLELAEITTLGVRVRAPIRTATFVGCRFDWTSNGSVGVQVDASAQDTQLINTQWDIGGSGITLLADSGTRTCRYEGNQIIGAPVFRNSAFIKDETSSNPGLDLGTAAGSQKGLIQITGSIFDFFAGSGFTLRFRVNGGTTVMAADGSGNVSAGLGTLATNATNGFFYVPTCAGTPTGAPTAVAGYAPVIVNTTNNKLYFYSGGAWRDAGP